MTDTSSTQAKAGKDIQGVPWERLDITREGYRRTRLQQYRNYENIPLSGVSVDKVRTILLPVYKYIKMITYYSFDIMLMFTCAGIQTKVKGR